MKDIKSHSMMRGVNIEADFDCWIRKSRLYMELNAMGKCYMSRQFGLIAEENLHQWIIEDINRFNCEIKYSEPRSIPMGESHGDVY